MAAKPKSASGDDGVLPPELVTEVLHRLPAKLLLRCRSVCKSWYALISSPNFGSEYSVRNLNKNGNRVLLQPYDNTGNFNFMQPCPFRSHEESFMESREHDDDLPERFLGFRVGIVGSCNGLICLSRFDPVDVCKNSVTTFLIWNPSIGKSVELPLRTIWSVARTFSYYGFGFDSKTGDYKVMCTHSAYGCEFPGEKADVCEIFDLRKGFWRGIDRPRAQLWRVKSPHPECYLHGSVHWTGYIRREDDRCDRVLLSFDFSDEVFRGMLLPDCVGDPPIQTRSVTFDGLIHLIVWNMVGLGAYIDLLEDGCSIWAMKEYGVTESWSKLFNIDMQSAQLYGKVYPEKFRFYENGEILMVHDLRGDEDEYVNNSSFTTRQGFVLYNTESRECKRVCSLTECITDLCLYKESLVLL